MGQKRSREEGKEDKDAPPADTEVDKKDEESNDDEDFDEIQVEFEWFNFDPKVDFDGTKTLMRQLFDVDAILFNMSALANLILSQPTIGSTVKCDGKQTDAYALLTVLNTHEHREKEPMKQILNYLVEKSQADPSLQPVADAINAEKQIGLLLSERLINMPAQVAPPLYEMLTEEVAAAEEDGEPYNFSHYLILSKTYQEVESSLDVGNRKRKKIKGEPGTYYYFHAEDEVLHKHAVAYGSFPHTKEGDAVADSRRAFQEMGVKTSGHMILIEAAKFNDAVTAVGDYIGRPE